jgi:hypothetical protein
MTDNAKMKAQPVPDTVRVRANLAALGLSRKQEVTITETPLIRGALDSGVLSLLERIPSEPTPEPVDDDLPTEPRKPKRTRASGNDPL